LQLFFLQHLLPVCMSLSYLQFNSLKAVCLGNYCWNQNKNNNLQLNSVVVFKLIFYIGRNCSLFLFAIEAQLPISTLVPMLFSVEFHNDKRKSSAPDKEFFRKYCAKSCHIMREKNLKSSYLDNTYLKLAKT
jgi:hypothetical protein